MLGEISCSDLVAFFQVYPEPRRRIEPDGPKVG